MLPLIMEHILTYSLALLFYMTLTAAEEHKLVQHFKDIISKPHFYTDGSDSGRGTRLTIRLRLSQPNILF